MYMRRSKELMVDYDGTLATWAYPDLGIPTAGAAHAMRKLRDKGYRIVVWTARMDGSVYSMAERVATLYKIKDWLAKHQIEYDEIDTLQAGKRVAGAYIDDKAIRFSGSWVDVMRDLEAHEAIEQARIKRTQEVYGVDNWSGPGFGGDRPVPPGFEWETDSGCNDKG